MSTDTLYRDMLNQIKALCADEPDLIANLANISALIYDQLDDINWAGFYLTRAPQMLVLGPFQGKVACVRIPFSQGVCGAAARLTRHCQACRDRD